jgi:hypothetical protein
MSRTFGFSSLGCPLQVNVPSIEAVKLSRKLDPTGLCLFVDGDLDPHGLDDLYRDICKPFRRLDTEL